MVETGKVIAEAVGLPAEEMARRTTANFYRLFAKADPLQRLSA